MFPQGSKIRRSPTCRRRQTALEMPTDRTPRFRIYRRHLIDFESAQWKDSNTQEVQDTVSDPNESPRHVLMTQKNQESTNGFENMQPQIQMIWAVLKTVISFSFLKFRRLRVLSGKCLIFQEVQRDVNDKGCETRKFHVFSGEGETLMRLSGAASSTKFPNTKSTRDAGETL